nr:hypothetical protein [Tanacetum cinerariifolium]
MPNLPVVPKEHEGSDDYTEVTYDKEQCLSDHCTALVIPPAYTPYISFLATMEHANTLSIGYEVISIIPARENDEFIKSSVDDLVRGEHLDTLSTEDREINFNRRDIETNDLIPGLRMFDIPLGNDDSVSRSFNVTFSNPLFDFNDDYTLCYDNPLFDEEFEDISSLDPPDSTLIIDESSLLVTPLPDHKQVCLKEMERFNTFFSLTQSGGIMRVMKTCSLGFHHMPSPRPAAYSPKEVMYCYFDLHLISGDRFDHGPKMK